MLALKILSKLPPEFAHSLTIKMLKAGFGPKVKRDVGLGKGLLGHHIHNPIGLAAGCDKNGEAIDAWFDMGFGFVEIGTIMPRPRQGNPKPRIWRVQDNSFDKYIVNWMGLPSLGVEQVKRNIQEYREYEKKKKLIGANIALDPNNPNIYDIPKMIYDLCPYVDYFTLNVSCPNTTENSNSLKDLIITATTHTQLPILLKLAPTDEENRNNMLDTAGMAIEFGVKGFIVCNTIPYGMKHLIQSKPKWKWPQVNEVPVGGLSGHDENARTAWSMAYHLRKSFPNTTIIGVGGIQGRTRALSVLEHCDAIQLFTGLVYKGPKLLEEIKEEIFWRK